jgi:hypothetical protein
MGGFADWPPIIRLAGFVCNARGLSSSGSWVRPEWRLSPLFYQDDQISIIPAPFGKAFKFVLSDLNVMRLDFDMHL